ncbi:recombinase family protein [Nocardia salmonicida]|uniref:recombinase family protein n=1 Tax=Nocardia salmonicida TaxID=53431 RepID=UPI0035A23D0C
MLTSAEIDCPSAHDRARNSHREGAAWSKSAIRAILTNPRYTGYAVWNRQRKQGNTHRCRGRRPGPRNTTHLESEVAVGVFRSARA